MRRLAALVVAATLVGCTSGATTVTERPTRTERPTPEASLSALYQMSVVFIGGYSEDEIKAKVDASLADFGLEPTEENYRNVGDTLVALRKYNIEEVGCPRCTEMAILDYMLATGPLEGLEWHEAAAWASSFVVAEAGS